MRIVAAIDGDLLVSGAVGSGIPGQKREIVRVVQSLSSLLRSNHELVLTHGNAPQVGYVLLRSEAASHIIHRVPLDVCGSDTQGATGYMLQQSILNWLRQASVNKEVCTLVTQVLVDESDPDTDHPTRGVGPFYDREKAQAYASTHGWEFVLIPGYGYRRAVPSLMPKRIIEVNSIRSLLNKERIVICAGGGGIPVSYTPGGELYGLEVVVDKAFTTSLLAAQIEADGILFISIQARVEELLHKKMERSPIHFPPEYAESLLAPQSGVDEDMHSKLLASRWFIQKGGKWVVITSPGYIRETPFDCGGILIEKESIPSVQR
jgi:carbamate kinase